VFFSGYRIVKESTEIVALKSVEDDYPKDADVPKDSIPTLLGVLYMGVSAACAMFLCSGLMLFGVYKSVPTFLFSWVVVSSIYVIFDLSVLIYIGVTYNDLGDVAVTIALASVWDALDIYFIMVVGAYFKSLTGRFIPSSGYQNVDA